MSTSDEEPTVQGLEPLGMTGEMLKTLEKLGIYARATSLVR